MMIKITLTLYNTRIYNVCYKSASHTLFQHVRVVHRLPLSSSIDRRRGRTGFMYVSFPAQPMHPARFRRSQSRGAVLVSEAPPRCLAAAR